MNVKTISIGVLIVMSRCAKQGFGQPANFMVHGRTQAQDRAQRIENGLNGYTLMPLLG